MREDSRTLGVIHSARFIGGGSGLARYGPEALVAAHVPSTLNRVVRTLPLTRRSAGMTARRTLAARNAARYSEP